MTIQVKNICKRYGSFTALNDVNLEVNPGELLALLGPSGSGKTTLLRIIAGLDFPESGRVFLDGSETQEKHIKDRNVGFVFQHYALFRNMTVFENVAFGLRVRPNHRRPSDDVIMHKVMGLLELVHMEAFHDRYPAQLSGGQRQRVALARALAVEPKVLLLDEPFGALDAKVRKELRQWMRRLHDDIHITSIFVTHDQEEAMEVADRVVVMNQGRIEQIGTPDEVYHSPANSFVYDFLGNYNEFDGWRGSDGAIHIVEDDITESAISLASSGGWLSRYPGIESVVQRIMPVLAEKKYSISPARRNKPKLTEGQPVKLFARPHEMFITRTTDDGHEYIPVNVLHINPAGALAKLDLQRRSGRIIQAELPKQVIDDLKIKKNDDIFVRPKTMKVFE